MKRTWYLKKYKHSDYDHYIEVLLVQETPSGRKIMLPDGREKIVLHSETLDTIGDWRS